METGNSEQRVRTLVLGLDGATMSLLSSLMAKALLPNLKHLVDNGVQRSLMSTVPPFTGPAWVSICTGVNPGRHGIYGFGTMDAESGEMSLARTEHIGSPRLWQLINAYGLTTGVVNVPLIYPPDPVDGFMLTGMLTPPKSEQFAYPSWAADSVYTALGGEYIVDVRVDPLRHGHDTRIISQLTQLLHQREQVVHALLDHSVPDFLMVVLVIPDRLQHLYWGYMIPNASDDPVYYSPQARTFRTELESLYRKLDIVVGRLLDRAGPDCRTFVVSDHGFARYEREVNINNWLRDQGWLYLRVGSSFLQTLKRGVHRTLGTRRANRLSPRRLVRSTHGRLIDWSMTQAYTGTFFQQGIYINLKGRQPHGRVAPGVDYETLRQEIAAGLTELRDPRSGELLFERVYLREELFQGPYVDRAPDILPVIRGSNGLLSPHFGNGHLVQYRSDQPEGCHHPDGILFASGPGVRRNVRLTTANVIDITPTALYSLGLPIPNDLDGKVLEEIFEPDELSANPPQIAKHSASQIVASLPASGRAGLDSSYSDEDKKAIIERLEGLGYL